MKMPTVYDDDILRIEHGFCPVGEPKRTKVYSIVYPPVGFFPFAGIGNGDYYGFYWPIGREDSPPMVTYSSHDAYALIPEHGNLSSAARCQLALDEGRELTHDFATALDATGVPRPTIDRTDAIAVDDHQQLLVLDPDSPFRNCAVADLMVGRNELNDAEHHYRRAIELLPEYGAAHFGLGNLLRRTRRQCDASIHLRKALMCPIVFWGGCFWAEHVLPGSFRHDWARKALLWLQQTRDPDESIRDDPFFQNVKHLSFQPSVAEGRDFELYTAMVDSYRSRGQFFDAVYLWITVGERAALETTSFRERHGFTARSYADRLVSLLRDTGIERRAKLVENMISIMNKPHGLYL